MPPLLTFVSEWYVAVLGVLHPAISKVWPLRTGGHGVVLPSRIAVGFPRRLRRK
jgi:hypothetical protein